MATVRELVEALKVQVAETIGMEQSALVLMQGQRQQLQDLINQGATVEELQAMLDALDAKEKELAAAVVTNP